MSIFVQEVLGLLKRNFVKTSLNPTDDYFQFVRKGALSRAKTSAGGFAPQGQALSISAGSWLCSQTGPLGLGRFTSTQKYSGEPGIIPVYTVPSGQCNWNTIKDSIMSQEIGVGDPMIYVGTSFKPASLTVYDRVFIPKLQPTNPFPNFRGQVVFADKDGELETNDSFTFTNGNNFLVNGAVNTSFGSITTGASSPPTSTRVNNKLILSGPVFDAASAGGGTGLPNIGQVLIAREDPNNAGVSDGRVLWGDQAIPDLQFGELIIGYKNPQPAPGTIVPAVGSFTSGALGTGNNNDVLTSGGPTGFPSWAPNPGIGGSGTPFRLSAFNTSNTLIDSLLVQDNNLPIVDPSFATQTITNSGKWINTGTMKLLDVPQDATQEKVLVLDTSTGQVKFRFANSIGLTGNSTLRRVPLWSPDGLNLQSSLLIQSDMVQPPANYPVADPNFTNQKLTNDGSLQQTKELYLDSVKQDDTLTEVLVRDASSANEVKFRNVATIVPPVGFDTLTMSTTADWNQTFLNAYISLDDTTVPYRSIKGMTTLTDGQTGVVIAENVKQGTFLADDVLRFPIGWGTVGNLYNSKISWAAGFDNGYPTSTLKYGESLKFKYHNYEIPGGGFAYKYVLYWESCCKLFSLNTCPTVSNATYTAVEDNPISNTVTAVDDGYGGYTGVYTASALANPAAGTLVFNSSTGAFTFTPTANFNGSTTFTYTYNDGYCDSAPGTIVLNITPVAEPPIWTSTDPVTANTYPNLTGGDAWTYTWTTSDADHPCSALNYVITVNANSTGAVQIWPLPSGQPSPSWLTFTPDNPHTCTGTLAGTYPVAGGNFEVIMEVRDPDPNLATQSFTIGGLTVTKDSYFVFCSDTSGSMITTIQETAQMSSVPVVTSKSNGAFTGSTTLRLASGNQAGRVNDPSGLVDDSFLCIIDGMNVSGNGITAGTTVVSGGGSTPSNATITLTLSANHFATANDVLTFTLTQNQKDAAYSGANNFRNLLQDYYATGGTASGIGNPGGVPNTNAATNGQDMYDSHLYWYHNPQERPIGYLGFQAQGGFQVATIGSTGYFPDAESIVVMAWADESGTQAGPPPQTNTYKASPGETGADTWNDRASSVNTVLVADVSATRGFINALEGVAGNNSIYRGIAFRVLTGANNDLEEIMGPNGFAQTGGRQALGYIYPPEALAYTVNTQSLQSFSSTAPKRITYVGSVSNQPSNGSVYYYNLVRQELIAIGFSI